MGKNEGTIDPDGIETAPEITDEESVPVDGIGQGTEDDGDTIPADGFGAADASEDTDTIDADGNGPEDADESNPQAKSDDEKLLDELLGDEPKAEPKAETKPEPKAEPKADPKVEPKAAAPANENLADALEVLTIPKEAMSELRDMIGDEAASKVVEPLVAKVATLQKYVRGLVAALEERSVASRVDELLDSLNAPELGSRFDADDKQQANRREVVATAQTLMERSQAKGQKIAPKKAVQMALVALTRVNKGGNAPTANDIEKRSRLVGVVPASARSTVTVKKKGVKAAAAAVDRKLQEKGLA